MSTPRRHRTDSWRKILMRYGPPFERWLLEHNLRYEALDRLATDLETFLKARVVDETACRDFWNAIPRVLDACNDNSTYEIPFAAEAYSYLHLLERYRRTWDVLLHLVDLASLPLADRGVAVLDVGTGPAPTLYAVSDFYGLLRRFGDEFEVSEFHAQSVKLDAVEGSVSMSRFVHHFSEYTGRREGPFGFTFRDFEALNLAERRDSIRRGLLAEEDWDESERAHVPRWTETNANESSMGAYRYRLVTISNFLTLTATIGRFRSELVNLFNDLGTGSVILVTGGYGQHYPKIYEDLRGIAVAAGLTPIDEAVSVLGESDVWGQVPRIRAFYAAVYEHLCATWGREELPHAGHPDLKNPRLRLRFGLRVFRRNRSPQRVAAV